MLWSNNIRNNLLIVLCFVLAGHTLLSLSSCDDSEKSGLVGHWKLDEGLVRNLVMWGEKSTNPEIQETAKESLFKLE